MNGEKAKKTEKGCTQKNRIPHPRLKRIDFQIDSLEVWVFDWGSLWFRLIETIKATNELIN